MTGHRTNSVHRGFTLLEVLLAVTILASVSALIASLWSQAFQWNADNSTFLRSLRLPRVYEMTRSQWGDRRSAIEVSENFETIRTSHDRITFITATPILNPDAALVSATYLIEPQELDMFGKPRAWDLVYEEGEVLDFAPRQSAMRDDDAEEEDRIGDRSRIVLLEGCSSLRWERFGRAARQMPETDSPEERSQDQRGRSASDRSSAATNSLDLRQEDEDAQRVRWRPFEREYHGSVYAMRLIGVYEDEEIEWQFVIGALR